MKGSEHSLEDLLAMITPEVYQRLMSAVETGRWPDGRVVTGDARQQALQMTLLYQSRYNNSAQHMTVNRRGEIEMKSKSELKTQFQSETVEIARLKPEDDN
ncbi:MAG: hypothetical protein CENE_00254 [Candidatus Celerinatantimonas neptuna]|nr:MAG: hypothetical protein CENE_00254 [Candidatus Celerinatantimonas neptuna]